MYKYMVVIYTEYCYILFYATVVHLYYTVNFTI